MFIIMVRTTKTKLIPNSMNLCLLVIHHLANFNKRTLKIEESIHAIFYDFSSNDDKLREEEDQGAWMTSHSYKKT